MNHKLKLLIIFKSRFKKWISGRNISTMNEDLFDCVNTYVRSFWNTIDIFIGKSQKNMYPFVEDRSNGVNDKWFWSDSNGNGWYNDWFMMIFWGPDETDFDFILSQYDFHRIKTENGWYMIDWLMFIFDQKTYEQTFLYYHF